MSISADFQGFPSDANLKGLKVMLAACNIGIVTLLLYRYHKIKLLDVLRMRTALCGVVGGVVVSRGTALLK